MLVKRRLFPVPQADPAKSPPNPSDTTEFDFPVSLPPSSQRKIEINPIEGNALVVTLLDEKLMDGKIIQATSEQLLLVMEKLHTIPLVQNEEVKPASPLQRTLILDFKNVESVSSAALSAFIPLNKKAEELKHKLIFCNLSLHLIEIFQATALNDLFDIRKTREDAVVVANGLGERECQDKPFSRPVIVKT